MASVTLRSPGQVQPLFIHQNLEGQGFLVKTSAIAKSVFAEVKPFGKLAIQTWLVIQIVQATLLYPITAICLALISGVAYRNRSHIVNTYLLHADMVKHYLKRKSWFKEIGDYKVVLGGIPLENKNHAPKLQDMGVKRVIALTEEEEGSTIHLMANPVSYQKLQAFGIDSKELIIKAGEFVSVEALDVLVDSMKEIKAQNGKTYLYAKSGSLQSAIVAAAYLIKAEGLSATEAIQVIQKEDPSIKFNEKALGRVLSYDLHVPHPVEEPVVEIAQ